ncbi:MAG: hypothetical protein QOE61_409 [Micromonosporaceae bacterium]|nr:hypothetical protein [Micromonosporaceae bacterium]
MTDETDLRARHLDTLQLIISRLSQNSFTVRGWSITLVTAAFALLATQRLNSTLVLFTLVPTWIFWGLDASYMRTERLFRALYTAATNRLNHPDAQPDIKPYDTDTTPFKHTTTSWLRLLLRPSVAAIPAILTIMIITYAWINA